MPLDEYNYVPTVPKAEMDNITAAAGRIEAYQKAHPDEMVTRADIGVVLGRNGKVVKVPLVDEARAEFANSLMEGKDGRGYIPQAQIAAYLDGVVKDFGLEERAARIGTAGATGAQSATLSFLRKGESSLDANGNPVGWTGYNIIGNKPVGIVRHANAWDGLPGIQDDNEINVAEDVYPVDAVSGNGEINPDALLRKGAELKSKGIIPIHYTQADILNMSGGFWTPEAMRAYAEGVRKQGGIAIAESVYRGASAAAPEDIEEAYARDIQLIQELVRAGVLSFFTHTESKRGNFPGRVGALIHVPLLGQNVADIQSQLNKRARVKGEWFVHPEFATYNGIYKFGESDNLHNQVKEHVVGRIVEGNADARANVDPNSPLGKLLQNRRSFLLALPSESGANDILLQNGIGIVPTTDETDPNRRDAARVNMTAPLSVDDWSKINQIIDSSRL